MAVKKSELYGALWASCDELRGGMDASQYKDYVLVLLFLKYVSDRYEEGDEYSPLIIPKGSGFKNMVKLKGSADIGDKINKKIIGPIRDANQLTGMPDFNDKTKLGDGKEMVDRLTNLIAIFERKELDFSKNRAENDDILGDAYEYLMMNFAQQSGKSKGQFYTPSEVSRVIAKIIKHLVKKVSPQTIAYDPTCGSGSLILKVADEFDAKISIYGQEKDIATTSLAKMNMILHDCPEAEIKQGNTLTTPLFKESDGRLKLADIVVANFPFSDKSWMNGMNLSTGDDSFQRFSGYGIPPAKNGDFAYLLHIVKSMKSKGKGAVVLPHGVLFRGNVEAEIRTNLIKKGYIRGIIGLPQNLFFGTGIAACILVLDKEDPEKRKGIFMIDASKGFMKDGDKNRLRSRDIHKIVDTFTSETDEEKFSRMVPISEIVKNGYNLNISRYIDTQEEEDLQNIQAHFQGEIPTIDINSEGKFWNVCPSLRKILFSKGSNNEFSRLKIEKDLLKETISNHSEFLSYSSDFQNLFTKWKKKHLTQLQNLEKGFHPKQLNFQISESLLEIYSKDPLIDPYEVYQHLMDYWNETMQDDCYLISSDGWKIEIKRIIEKNKKGQSIDKGWICELLPKELVMKKFFQSEQSEIQTFEEELETLQSQMTEWEEEQSSEEGYFSGWDKINKATIQSRLKEISETEENKEEFDFLTSYNQNLDMQAKISKTLKEKIKELDTLLLKKYPELKENEIKHLIIEEKWLSTLETKFTSELDRVSQKVSQKLTELAERYETPIPNLEDNLKKLEKKVSKHLQKIGVNF